MADIEAMAWQAAQVIGLAFAGFLAGKAVHKAVSLLAERVGKAGVQSLGARVLRAIEGPLVLAAILFVVFMLSAYAQGLDGLRAALLQYLPSIAVVVLAYLLAQLLDALLAWYYEREKSKPGAAGGFEVLPLLQKLLWAFLILWGVAFALALVGFDLTGVLAVTGIAALVIGFAAQETLGNIIAGIALQLEGQFSYGESLRLADGSVAKLQKIGWRSSLLFNEDGDTIVLPNGEFAKQQVANLNRPVADFRAHVLVRLPANFDVRKYEEYIKKHLAGVGNLGLKSEDSRVEVKRVLRKGCDVDVNFWMADHFLLGQATDFVGRKTLEFRRKTVF